MRERERERKSAHTRETESQKALIVCLFPGGSEVKASTCNAGDVGSIPGSGRPPRTGNGNPLQYSCLENPMDRGAWQSTVHGVAKSRTRLSDFTSLHFIGFCYNIASVLCFGFLVTRNLAYGILASWWAIEPTPSAPAALKGEVVTTGEPGKFQVNILNLKPGPHFL